MSITIVNNREINRQQVASTPKAEQLTVSLKELRNELVEKAKILDVLENKSLTNEEVAQTKLELSKTIGELDEMLNKLEA